MNGDSIYSCENGCSGKVSQHKYYNTLRFSSQQCCNVKYEYTVRLLLMSCVLSDTPYEMSGLLGKG